MSKERIFEIYINIAEWGGGSIGIQQASQRYFGVDPSELQVAELALLAAILPNPTRFGAAIENGRLHASRLHKVGRILKNLRFLKHIKYSEFKTAFDQSLTGVIGRLALEPCNDDGSMPSAPSCGSVP